MTILHGIIKILVFLVLLFIGLCFFMTPFFPNIWSNVGLSVSGKYLIELMIGLFFVCLALLFALTGKQKKQKKSFLSFENEGGIVSISTDAIVDYISKLTTEFPPVFFLNPLVIPRHNAIDILVDIKIKAGAQIHEVCESIQTRIRESLASGLGITEIKHIEVNVKEIVSE